jgi:hypothetical protein
VDTLMAYPDIYHVTPMTPNAAMESVCAGRNVLISMYDSRQPQRALRLAAKILRTMAGSQRG